MVPARTLQDKLLAAPLPEVRIPAGRELPETRMAPPGPASRHKLCLSKRTACTEMATSTKKHETGRAQSGTADYS